MTGLGPAIVTAAAAFASGILAGASLDQSIKQLPARRKIGAVAFRNYVRAADLGSGVVWYSALGVGAAALTLAASLAAVFGLREPRVRLPAIAAGALAILHTLTTTRAAPIYLGLRSELPATDALEATFTRFARWQAARAALQTMTFAALLWLLAQTIAVGLAILSA